MKKIEQSGKKAPAMAGSVPFSSSINIHCPGGCDVSRGRQKFVYYGERHGECVLQDEAVAEMYCSDSSYAPSAWKIARRIRS